MRIIGKYKTSNYDLFAFEIGNRDYKEWWANELAKRIKTKNMLSIRPIICVRRNGRLYIIDGQHRLGACKILGIPVPYEIVEGITPQDIAVLNANQKGWGTTDYLNHYVQLGHKDYITIQKFIEETGFAVSVACNLCQCKSNEGGQGMAFRSGAITVTDKSMKQAREVASVVSKMRDAGVLFSRDRSLVKAIHSILIAHPQFDVPRFIVRLKSNPFEKKANWLQYVMEIESVYNARVRIETKVSLMGAIQSHPSKLINKH